jgi:beta-galactosidase
VAGLTSNVDRGPTPVGESFMPTRTSVPIARAAAGGNADRAELSFDDDETTEWSNGEGVSSAWIRYELERLACVDEVTMKLANWRNRSYPLRILIDNQEVFRGNSERTFGYVSFKFRPTAGRSIRVELIGAAAEDDALSDNVEVADVRTYEPKIPEQNGSETREERRRQARRDQGNNTLRILEVEVYEPLTL